MGIIKKKLVIFDMDGVLADTAPFHALAWNEFAKIHNCRIKKDFLSQVFGLGNDDIFPSLFNRRLSRAELDAFCAEKERIFRKLIKGAVRPFPGVVPLIKDLRGASYILAIGSSAIRANIKAVIREMRIERYLTRIISNKDVRWAKPEPDIFLKAAKECGVPPGRSLVIEDSIHGVIAARRAGMKVIAVTNSHPASKFPGADHITPSLARVSVATCGRLLGLS